jgi:hypothetical protein
VTPHDAPARRRDDGPGPRRAWNRHLDALGWRPTGDLARRGFARGALPDGVTARVAEALADAAPLPFHPTDGDPDWAYSNLSAAHLAGLARNHVFLRLGERELWAVDEALEHLAAPVAARLGCPWRVLNVRAWRTPAAAEPCGPNAWHLDGFVERILKAMLFLTPASLATGTIEIEGRDGARTLVEGPPGTWVLLESSRVRHRGVAPAAPPHERLAVEITLVAWWDLATRAVAAGLNARYPLHPWMGAAASTRGSVPA